MDITGDIIFNIRALDNGTIVNLANDHTGINTQYSPTGQVSKTQTKFSKYSMHSSYGHGNFYSYIKPGCLNLADTDFTLSLWIYRSGVYSGGYGRCEDIFDFYNNANRWQDGIFSLKTGQDSVDRIVIIENDNGTEEIMHVSGPQVPYNQWVHVALTRQNYIYRVFLNGTKYIESSFSSSTCLKNPSAVQCLSGVGSIPTTGIYRYVDDYIFIKGQALWTSNFTPPTEYLYTPTTEVTKHNIIFPNNISAKTKSY